MILLKAKPIAMAFKSLSGTNGMFGTQQLVMLLKWKLGAHILLILLLELFTTKPITYRELEPRMRDD